METNGILQKHWLGVLIAFLTDALLLVLAFVVSSSLVLGEENWLVYFPNYISSILLGAVVLPCVCYIAGLYAAQGSQHNLFVRTFLVALCLAVCIGFMVGAFYVNFSGRIGRGVMFLGVTFTFGMLVLHHAFLLHRARNYRERVALLVASAFDEAEAALLERFGGANLELVGVVGGGDYTPSGKLRVLGRVTELEKIARRERLDRVLCTNRSITDASLYPCFCQLRYSGVPVMPLINLWEELYHCVPLELVTPEWLMSASGAPHVFYIKKLKRGFDIICSLIGLVMLGPVLLLAALVTKLTSPGPVFYRQTRSGRFGAVFQVIKLRTMRLDAEKDGARWAAENDPRVTWWGRFFRKFRIDEIPQLVNVLRGEMSFVGPRPERPEFVKRLAAAIPCYEERLMVQPGLTGWAQVNYPYGSSVEDARRKLEYDLYYMKNMSLFLDMFILLDTVRIILRGGLGASARQAVPSWREMLDQQEAASVMRELPVPAVKPGPGA